MNLLEIDGVSFATRVAHVAAAELYGLLHTGNPVSVEGWYFGVGEGAGAVPRAPERMAAEIEELGDYVAGKAEPQAETLWRFACSRDIVGGEWFGRSFAQAEAYGVFVLVCQKIDSDLKKRQAVLQHARDQANAPAAPKLRLEDSIFAPNDKFSDLRPESVEASALAKKAREQQAKMIDAELEAAEAELETDEPTPLGPIKVGEAPAAIPQNKGGRGNRKRPGKSPAKSP